MGNPVLSRFQARVKLIIYINRTVTSRPDDVARNNTVSIVRYVIVLSAFNTTNGTNTSRKFFTQKSFSRRYATRDLDPLALSGAQYPEGFQKTPV